MAEAAKFRLFDFLVNDQVRAVRDSIDGNPLDWAPYYIHGKLYQLIHKRTGVSVWASNSVYGVDIQAPNGVVLWGDVTFVSSFFLSPSHWALYRAIRRWVYRAPPPPHPLDRKAQDYFAQVQA